MTLQYKVPSPRGPNAASQDGAKRRMESEDGTRWAISANRKRALANHRFDIVEVWMLKQRVDGVASIVAVNRSEEDAKEFVEGTNLA